MHTTKTIVLVCGLLLSQATLAEHPLVSSQFLFHIGDFRATKDVEIRVDGAGDVLGTPVDLSSAFGASDREDSFVTEARWRFGERWQVAAQYFRMSSSSTASLARDIDFAGYEFRAGVNVAAESGMKIARLFFGRDFVRDGAHTLGAGIGLHQIEISAAVSGEAFVDDVSVGARRAAGSANGPLPNVGAWYIWAPNDRWAVTTRVDWLSANVDPYDGTIINASAGVNFSFTPHVGVGLNYNVFSLDVGVTDDAWRGEIDIDYQGPFIMVSAYW
jgi:hypothetical protein